MWMNLEGWAQGNEPVTGGQSRQDPMPSAQRQGPHADGPHAEEQGLGPRHGAGTSISRWTWAQWA